MKIFAIPLLCGLVLFAGLSFRDSSPPEQNIPFSKKPASVNTRGNNVKLQQKAVAAKQYIQKNNFNSRTCFLIDMSIPSGRNRFFIYDLQKDSILSSAPVAHGNCFEFWLEGRRYSNRVGSGCTSLGRYRIGKSYTGRFGYSYKLHGLDSSNSNAYERTVVLHPYSEVPEQEVDDEICQSNGCPMVAPAFFQKLRSVINRSARPVLLWIYD